MARLIGATRRRGLALVETALILPLLLLLTIGLLEYGWVFLKIQQVNSAAREGVRVGVRAGGTNAQVTAAVSAVMNQAGMGGSGYTLTTTPANVSSAEPETTIKVRVEVTYDNIELIGAQLLVPVPTTLRGEYYMMKEGSTGGGT